MELIIDFVLVGGVLTTLTILFLLVKTQQLTLPNKLLILFFVFLLSVSLCFYAQLHEVKWLYLLTFLPEDTIVWIIGPILMLYIKSLFQPADGFVRRHLVHFLPFALYTLGISIPVLISILQGEALFSYLVVLHEDAVSGIILLRSIHLLIYIGISLYLFRKYKGLMKSNYSTLSEKQFLWVRQMLIGVAVVVGIDLLTECYAWLAGEEILLIGGDDGYITVLAMVVLIVYLGYFGVKQAKIRLPEFLLEEGKTEDREMSAEMKPKANAKSLEKARAIEEKLERVMAAEKPYLDEDLTLSKLAALLGTTDKKLSGFLNGHLQTTFYDLINKARVEAVQEMLRSDGHDHLTLLGIAFECGFKSKTSFNRVFKQQTGMSPSEYRKKHQ